MLCAQGPVGSPVELSLEPEFRRRHGSVYDALAKGRISSGCLRHLLAGLSAQARAGEPLMFTMDITPHARPDAQYADERTVAQARGKGGDRWLPGWPYSLLVGIQSRFFLLGQSHRGTPAAARRGAHRRHGRPDHRAAQRPDRNRVVAARRPAPAGPAKRGQLRHPASPTPWPAMTCNCWSSWFPPGPSALDPAPRRPGQIGVAGAPRRGVSPAPSPPDGTPPTSSAPQSPGSPRHRGPSAPGQDCAKTSAAPAAGPAGRGTSSCRIVRGTVLQRSGRRPPARRPQATQGPVAVALQPRPGRPGPALEGLPCAASTKSTSTASQRPILAWPAHT